MRKFSNGFKGLVVAIISGYSGTMIGSLIGFPTGWIALLAGWGLGITLQVFISKRKGA